MLELRWNGPNRAVAFTVAWLALVATGCTVIRSERVDPKNKQKAKGLHYYLPKPAIQMVPTATGAIEVKVYNLPDVQHEYTLDSYSFMATHRLEVDRSRGMLSKVSWQADSSAVAASAVVASGKVSNSAVGAKAKAEKARRDNIATATSALATAEKEYEVSRRSLEAYQARTDDAARTAEKAEAITLITKDEARKAASAALEAAKHAPVIPDPANLSLDVPSGTAGSTGSLEGGSPTADTIEFSSATIHVGKFNREVYGGMVLLVDERDDAGTQTVVLRPLVYGNKGGEAQAKFESKTISKLAVLKLIPEGQNFVALNPNAKMEVDLNFNADVYDVTGVASLTGGPAPKVRFTFPRKLVVDMSGFGPGTYSLTADAKKLEFPLPTTTDTVGFEIVVTSTTPPAAPSISPTGTQTARADTNGISTLTYVVTGEPYAVSPESCKRGANEVAPPSVALGSDKKLTVDVTGQPSGDYELVIGSKYRDAITNQERSNSWTLRYRITPGIPALLPMGTVSVRPDSGGDAKAEFTLSKSIAGIDFDRIQFRKGEEAQPSPPVQLSEAKKLAVDLSGVAAGNYRLLIPFRYDDDQGETVDSQWTIDFRVLPPKPK